MQYPISAFTLIRFAKMWFELCLWRYLIDGWSLSLILSNLVGSWYQDFVPTFYSDVVLRRHAVRYTGFKYFKFFFLGPRTFGWIETKLETVLKCGQTPSCKGCNEYINSRGCALCKTFKITISSFIRASHWHYCNGNNNRDSWELNSVWNRVWFQK